MEEKGVGKTCAKCGYKGEYVSESLLHLPPGTVLQNKYLLGRVLGQGGFGITYLAWDITLNIKLAIKEYLPQQHATRTVGQSTVTFYTSSFKEDYRYGLSKFLEEARTLARFNEHPNIVTVRDYFEANNTAYLVMNYHEGITLQNYLKKKDGKIMVEQALAIFMPVLDALKEVHAAGIMHRDISPDNIFIDKDGRIILIDFGAARQEMREKSKSFSVVLKAGYAPEEQYRTKGEQGPWTDIYAVGATLYHCITGNIPPEAIDRLVEDDLVAPSNMGVKIKPALEDCLLKALAVKAPDRYQKAVDFQDDLIASVSSVQGAVDYTDLRLNEKGEIHKASDEKSDLTPVKNSKDGVNDQVVGKSERQFISAGKKKEDPQKDTPSGLLSKITFGNFVLVFIFVMLVIGGFRFFGIINNNLDADYYIDYKNGNIPLSELPIGARVVDPSWQWEFRVGSDYLENGAVKPVTWVVVANNHYDDLGPHTTLLVEGIIGLYAFDNSTDRGHNYQEYGFNHWGESGTNDATRGLRFWLNSTDIHKNEGFYQAFSEDFKQALLKTTIPNKDWKNGINYSTQETVFLPSTTELGDNDHDWTYQIGSVYSYFYDINDAQRVAEINGETWWYWTRSPDYRLASLVRSVALEGGFMDYHANNVLIGVRPAINMKSDIRVTKVRK